MIFTHTERGPRFPCLCLLDKVASPPAARVFNLKCSCQSCCHFRQFLTPVFQNNPKNPIPPPCVSTKSTNYAGLSHDAKLENLLSWFIFIILGLARSFGIYPGLIPAILILSLSITSHFLPIPTSMIIFLAFPEGCNIKFWKFYIKIIIGMQ